MKHCPWCHSELTDEQYAGLFKRNGDGEHSDPSENAEGLVMHDHPDTAQMAALHNAPRSGTQRRRVLEAIITLPRTDEEIQQALGMVGNTERPRRVELVRGGWITDSGMRRRTLAGEDAIVWQLVDGRRAELEGASG